MINACCRNYESHQERLDRINRQNEVKQKKGIIESDYIKMKKQLSKYKNRAGEFKQQGKRRSWELSAIFT